MDSKILEFVFFCVEGIAEKLNKDTVKIYDDLTKKSDLLNSYIVANYDVLHTQGKEYIVEDVIGVMRETGLKV